MHHPKRLVALFAFVGALLLATMPGAVAGGSPHFIKHATSVSLSGTDLVAQFKEAGLASGATETIALTATATTTYECVNHGGHNPSAANKTTTVTQVTQSGQFTADQNGNVVGSLTLSPPSATALGFACPPGQTVTFVSVTYTNVQLVDTTSGATMSFPGEFTATNPSAP